MKNENNFSQLIFLKTRGMMMMMDSVQFQALDMNDVIYRQILYTHN